MSSEWIPFIQRFTSAFINGGGNNDIISSVFFKNKPNNLNNLRSPYQTAYIYEKISTNVEKSLARLTHAVSYNGCMYIFGGAQNFSQVFNDVHEYNPQTNNWTRLKTSGARPTKRSDASAVIYNDSLIIFGGCDILDQICDDIYLMDFKSKHWHEIQVYPGGYIPRARCQHSAVIYKDEIIIFGGLCGHNEFLNDVNKFTFKTFSWTKVECSGKIPSSRSSHSAVVYENNMFIFGGSKHDEIIGGQLFVLDLDCFKWKQIESFGQPQLVFGHSAVVYENNMFIVCGSFGRRDYSNSLYRFNLNTYKWKKIKPFSYKSELLKPRSYHSSVIIDNELYIFGGIIDFGIQCSELFKIKLNVEPPISIDRLAFIDVHFE